MEHLCRLLFELSNEDRLRILHHLKRGAMNVSRLSRELGLSTQECSRHLSRLVEVGLTKKDVEGLHNISSLGNLVLKQLPGLGFICKHSDYFSTHSLERLPPEFVSRIGDLSSSTYVNDVMEAFHSVDEVIREAEEYIWSITDQYLLSTMPLLREAFERGVKAGQIEAKDWVVPARIREAVNRLPAENREAFARARTSGLLEERVLERLDVYLYMSEKEVAGVAFPLQDGSFDYLGFSAMDERSRRWCGDLFEYYWERARSRSKVIEELYRWVRERPKAIRVLKDIAAGKEIVGEKELIPELENMGLAKEGDLTYLGQIMYARFQQ